MLIALWIVNALLALVFLAAGLNKVARPREVLAQSGMAWALDLSGGSVKAIGALEVVGAIGLIVPLLTGIASWLVVAAAIGLAVVMAGAIVVHVRRHESAVPAIILAVALVVSAVIGVLAL